MALDSEQQAEIQAAAAQEFTTKRPTVPALEDRMFQPIHCLDHGFVRLIDYMGDDSAIVQAARVSYGAGTKKMRQDRGLIRYLLRHRHTTPFEMCELKIHVKLPIFVARQWIRHRTANVNEISARYSVLDNEFYLPSPEHLAVQSTNNKQGRGEALTAEQSALVLAMLKRDATQAYDTYSELLGEEMGLARELARMNLPVNWYTQWYWKVDLHNLLHFWPCEWMRTHNMRFGCLRMRSATLSRTGCHTFGKPFKIIGWAGRFLLARSWKSFRLG